MTVWMLYLDPFVSCSLYQDPQFSGQHVTMVSRIAVLVRYSKVNEIHETFDLSHGWT
jgi:hypothetical protein